MIIAETRTFTLGKYTVQQRPRMDSPAWPVYVVFCGDRLVGKSFSMPDLGCCEWLERDAGYAEPRAQVQLPLRGVCAPGARRGRRTKAESEQELLEALST